MTHERVIRLLEEHGVPYEVLPHREAFTSQEVAQTAHVSGRDLAKVVVLRHGYGGHLLVILPANEHVKLNAVRRATGLEGLHFATEAEIERLFPDCPVGAEPPFGHLYGVPTYVDPCLLERPWIHFQAGSHRELIRIRGRDFEELERPAHVTGCLHATAESVHAVRY